RGVHVVGELRDLAVRQLGDVGVRYHVALLARGEDELEVVAVHRVDRLQHLALALEDAGLLAGLDVDLVDKRLAEAVRTAGPLAPGQVHVARGGHAHHVSLTAAGAGRSEAGPAPAANVSGRSAGAGEQARTAERPAPA